MAARVLHFGYDDCHRVRVLERAGYAVTESQTLADLDLSLQQSEPVELVVVSEGITPHAERAADLIRRRSTAPVILFRRSLGDLDERKFNAVYRWYVPAGEWLARTAELIEQSRRTRELSQQLRLESEAVRQESQRLRAQARAEAARNKPTPAD